MTYSEYVERGTQLARIRVDQFAMMQETVGVRREVHAMARDLAVVEDAILSRERSLGLVEDDGYYEDLCATFDGREHMVF